MTVGKQGAGTGLPNVRSCSHPKKCHHSDTADVPDYLATSYRCGSHANESR